MQELILLPEEESIGERADKYLAVQLPQYSRSFFQKLFKERFRTRRSRRVTALPEKKKSHLQSRMPRSRILFRKTFRWIFCMKIRISLW